MLKPSKIKALRINKGFTLKQLAAKLGCSASMITRWETGETQIGEEYEKALLALEKDPNGFYQQRL